MHTLKSLLLVALVALNPACKEPAVGGGDSGFAVSGRLAYRTTCQGGLFAPMPGVQMPGGPLVYLADAAGNRISALTRPDGAGAFTIANVPAGEHRLHIAAGDLQHFWLGEPVSSLGVTVEEADVSVGTVCADTVPFTNVAVRALWGDDYSQAAPESVLPIWAGAPQLDFVAAADTRDGRRNLDTVWYTDQNVLTVTAADGWGSFRRFEQTLRVYAERVSAAPRGGWMTFGHAVTAADLQLDTNSADGAWAFADEGLRAAVNSEAPVFMRSTLLTSFAVTAPAEFLAPVVVAGLAPGASFGLGLSRPEGVLASVNVVRGESGYRLELCGPAGVVLQSTTIDVLPLDESMVLSLTFNPATLEITAGFGDGAPAYRLASLATSWVAGTRLTPFVAIAHMGAAEATDVVFQGWYTNLRATLATLPAAVGTLAGVVYDQLTPMFVVSGRGTPARGGQAALVLDPGVKLARALVIYRGMRMTIYTDLGRDAIAAQADRIDDWAADAMVEISGGRAILY